jgi:hypothetical protein
MLDTKDTVNIFRTMHSMPQARLHVVAYTNDTMGMFTHTWLFVATVCVGKAYQTQARLIQAVNIEVEQLGSLLVRYLHDH